MAALPLALASCGGQGGKLTVRSLPTALAPGKQPVPFRIAEAQGYLRLGNVALALESFRKARRDDPTSVDALNGIAACYDRMGRFDLSRRYYEQALAIAPADSRLYANLAVSLDMQGRGSEAAAVRGEIRQRLTASASAPSPAAASAVVAPSPAPTVAPVASPVQPPPQPAVVPVAAPPASASPPAVAAVAGARLERLSLGEVALVTSARPLWQARVVERSRRSTTVVFTPLPAKASAAPAVLLLNAARVQGLAARTRSLLAREGWQQLAIGDARRAQSTSTIYYPPSRRAAAERLARELGVPMRRQAWQRRQIVVLLGRGAAGGVRPRSGRA